MTVGWAMLGGRPTGFHAALVLSRANRNVGVFDKKQPGHALAQESHESLIQGGT